MAIRFVLASASPARLETLRRVGVHPEVVVSHVDEDAVQRAHPGANTRTLTEKLAEAKATAVAQALEGPALVLGCDSMLDLDGVALGKPAGVSEAMDRWKQMRGRMGVLHTGHCLIDAESGEGIVTGASTEVHFADVTDSEIALYCVTGEPTRVAGAFTIDGLGGWFVKSIRGDHHNVVGLSLPLLRELLGQLGHELTDIGWPATD